MDFDTIRPEKTLTGAVKGVTVEQIQQLKEVAMTGAAAKQTVVALNKKNASLEKEKAHKQQYYAAKKRSYHRTPDDPLRPFRFAAANAARHKHVCTYGKTYEQIDNQLK